MKMSENTAAMLARIETRLTNIEQTVAEIKDDIKSDYYTCKEATALDKRVEKLEKGVVWVVSIVLGAVILAVLSLVIIK